MADLKDFSGLVDLYYAKIFYHCVKITKNNHDSADITQDTFTKAFISVKNLRNSESFGAWLFKICNNEINLFYRNRQKNISGSTDIENIKAKPSTSRKYNSLYSAIDILDEKYKKLVILKYFAEFSVKEISVLTGLEEKLIKSRLYDARRKLENLMSKNSASLLNNFNQERKKEIMSTVKLVELGSRVIPCMSAWSQRELLKCAEANKKFSSDVLSELARIEKAEEFAAECGGKLSYDELIKILARCDDSILYRMSGLEYHTWRGGRESKLLQDVAAYLGTGAHIESLEFIMTVPSIKDTMNWYKKYLGWGDGRDAQEAEDYGHTIIRVNTDDDMSLTFKGFQLWKDSSHGGTEVTKNLNCFVFVTGLNAMYEKIKATGWEKVSEIFEPGWGVRQFTVEDINGCKLHFSEWGGKCND